MNLIKTLYQKLKDATDSREKVDLINQLATEVKDNGNFNELLSLLDVAINISTKINYPLGLANSKVNKGLQLNFLGKREEAIKNIQDGINKLNVLNDESGLAYAYLCLGLCYWGGGEIYKALDTISKSIEVNTNNDPVNKGWSFYMLGTFYQELENEEQTFHYLSNSLELFETINYHQGLGRVLNSLSAIYIKRKELNKAKELTHKALQLHTKNDYDIGIARSLHDLGTISREASNIEEAQEFYFQGLALRIKISSPSPIITSLIALGDIFLLKEDYSQSIEFLESALKKANEIQANKKLIQIHKLLSLAHKKTEKYEKALVHFEKCYEYQTQLLTQDASAKISQLENKFDAALKEKEANLHKLKHIELKEKNENLSQQKEEIQAQAEMLKKSNREKELLLKEIHHRVKNNLQIILSLLNLQSYKHKDTYVLDALNECSSRIKSMALIHQKLYQSENLDLVDFNDYSRQLVAYLFSSFNIENNIKIEINGNHAPLKVESAIPLGLILNELVTNAIKYAFQNDGEGCIKISLSKLDSGISQLKVSDNGIGIDDQIDINSTKSLGLKLVDGLTKQLQGILKKENTCGSMFIIEFREKNGSDDSVFIKT